MWLMWLIRLLLVALLLAVITGALSAFIGGLTGKTPNRKRLCRKCGGTGWIAIGNSTKKSCGCGTVPAETQGPVIESPKQ